MITLDHLHRVQSGLSRLELIHVPHDAWPFHPRRPAPLPHTPLKVLVLDSSFNPPTLAHLALANTRATQPPDYDAKLLLLSIKNADKSFQPCDATYNQRLTMMSLLAQDILPNGDESNVAIAVTDQPTFVEKSSSLRLFLESRFHAISALHRNNVIREPQLTFALGFDTLERLVQPRYYGSTADMMTSLRKFSSPLPHGDNSNIVYARRVYSSSQPDQYANASHTLGAAQEFMAPGRIARVDIDENLSACSSSEVRNAIASQSPNAAQWRKLVTDRIADYIVAGHLYTRSDGSIADA